MSPAKAPRLNWRIFLLALGTFALGTDAFVIAGILPQLAAGLDVGIEAAGQVVSAYSLTYAFGAPLIAAAVSRWRRGQVVIAGLAMFTVANLLSAPVLLALLPMLMWSTGYFAVYIYLAPMLASWTSSDHLAELLLVFGLGCLAGNRMGGWLADRYGPFRPILVCAAGGALSQALLAMSPHSAFALASLLVAWGVCSWANFAPQQSGLLSIEPDHGPLVLSLNNSMNYLGSALGAAVGALTISATSVTYLPFAGGALYLAAVLALLVSRRWR